MIKTILTGGAFKHNNGNNNTKTEDYGSFMVDLNEIYGNVTEQNIYISDNDDATSKESVPEKGKEIEVENMFPKQIHTQMTVKQTKNTSVDQQTVPEQEPASDSNRITQNKNVLEHHRHDNDQ